jgi:hypothetical protein
VCRVLGRARSRRVDDKKCLDTLRQALEYVSLQRRILALDLQSDAPRARSDFVRTLARKLEAELLRARHRGYRRGLCWDVDSPAAGEGIGGVKYRW